ncbi:MAG: iron ABC transporter permease [Bacteroidaceae bacterium]|nr:iron ABC transporter permease [Bacteroidaceae bacterium]
MNMSKTRIYIILSLAIAVLFVASLFLGSVAIPAGETWNIMTGGEPAKESWRFIILESRLPQALTALLCGASLAVSGLMLQTAFDNPLAGPSILGINSGASLGVAVVMLASGGTVAAGAVSLAGLVAVTAGALAGALAVMALLLFFATLVRSRFTLLILGIMTGYVTTSAISLLNFFATAEGVHSYVIWGMGNFTGVSLKQMPWFAGTCAAGLALSVMLTKPLNALLLGERYAENLGVSIRTTRNLLLTATGLLTAVTTAFCGPVAFIGLAVPHIARMLLGTNNHNSMMPATIMTGSAVALLCNLLCSLPGEDGIIPLNAITPLLGAPVIIYVIIRGVNR